LKIGVVSDTHDFLDPRILELFQGVDHILHAGDVGMQIIVFELEQIAPTTAVLGNTDLGNPLKLTEIVTLGDLKFLVHHIVNPYAPDDKLKARLTRSRPDVVVFGHTHKAFNEVIGGVRFLNPGYAGKPKFGTERSVAILHCEGKDIRVEFVPLASDNQ
jgi:putative phosphoesterase